MIDTEHTEYVLVHNIPWDKCGVTKSEVYNAFALHDNDYGSHVYLPYVISWLLSPFWGFVAAVAYESTGILEKIYGYRMFHSTSSWTGPVDGMLQDPVAGFIGAALMIIQSKHCSWSVHELRRDYFQRYGVSRLFSTQTFAYILLSCAPLAVGHNFIEWMGYSVHDGAFRVWTMIFSFIVPALHAWYKDALTTIIFQLLAQTFALTLAGQCISYACSYYGAPDPCQSTVFWLLILFALSLCWLYSKPCKDNSYASV